MEAPKSPASSCDSSSPDEDLAIDMQLKYLCAIQTNPPFHDYTNESFIRLFESLQPNYKGASNTAINNLAFKRYLQAKKDLIHYFENFQSKVSFTIQAWNTYKECFSIPYTCITVHWIDPETWKMSKRVIAIQQFEDIDNFVLDAMSEFKVKDKVMSFTFEDCANIRYAPHLEMLKKEVNPLFDGAFFQTICVCGILNSMVQSCLDHVATVLTKFEDLYDYVFRSRKADEFESFVRGKGEKFYFILGFEPDQWNSLYKNLGRMIKQKSLIVEFYGSCGKSDIDDKDWETIESLLGILKVFHASIIRLCDAYHPTAHLVSGEILLIANVFKEYKQNPFWEPAILKMQSKFLKYYETMPPVFTCAAALDPKIGIGGVENILEDIAGCLNDSDHAYYATVNMAKCSAALDDLFGYYERMYISRVGEIVPSTCGDIITESVSRKKGRTMMISSELELYGKTDFSRVMSGDEYEKCEMVEWWRSKGRLQYPIMAEMVRDILTVKASSVALRFGFCLNGRVLTEEQTYKLLQLSQFDTTPLSEMRLFLKDHFDTNEGNQNDNLYEDDDEADLWSEMHVFLKDHLDKGEGNQNDNSSEDEDESEGDDDDYEDEDEDGDGDEDEDEDEDVDFS